MSGGKKAKQKKKQCETAKKKNLSPPQATARLASLSNLSSFFFSFTQSGAWSQAIGKSRLKKKRTERVHKNLPLYGARISKYPGNDLFSGCEEQSLPALTRLSTTIFHKNKPKSEAFSNFQLNNLLNLNY